MRLIRHAMAAAGFLAMAVAGGAFGQCTAVWNGGTGTWSSAVRWSPGTVPNSPGQAVCLPVAASQVNVDISPAVGSLQLSGNIVNVLSGKSLSVYGGVIDGGTVRLNGSALQLFPDTLFTGSQLLLSNSSLNAVIGTGGGFTNGGSLISGAGTFYGLHINNFGVFNAPSFSNMLILENLGGSNNGTLQASGGGTLSLSGGAWNNTGGTILANGPGAVVLVGSAITGGTLTSTNGGTIQAATGASLNGVTITGGSVYNAVDNTITGLQGTITNNGGIALNPTTHVTGLNLTANTTLQGGGTVSLGNSAFSQISGAITATLTNLDNLIQGAGKLGAGLIGIVNNGTILANESNTLLVQPGAGKLTNNGTLQVAAGSQLHVQADPGRFTNFANSTLTGGKYITAGTLAIDEFGSGGGGIVHNSAWIELNGTASAILDGGGANALSAFSDNQTLGSFFLEGGRSFFSAADFRNSGINWIDGGQFNTGSGGTAVYSQDGGYTMVIGEGILGASVINISGGFLAGQGGTVSGAVNITNGAYMTVGRGGFDPGALTVNGNYFQDATSVLHASFASYGFSSLRVNGNATLGGTLLLTPLSGFTAFAGQTFDIMDFVSRNGTVFDSVQGTDLGNGLYFRVQYNPNNITLVVDSAVPEPGTGLLFGCSLIVIAGLVRALRYE